MNGSASSSRTIKVAVMSFAHTHAGGYIRLLRSYDGVEVRASDPGPHVDGEDRGAVLAERLGVDYVDTYEELLAWKPDAVIITSENAHHRRLVERAAEAGAAILCEKPLATTLEDGRAIRDAVARAGVTLMVAFPVRFSSTFARIKALHGAGRFGELVSIRGSNNGKLPIDRAWFTDPQLSGGGALVDHVVHIADLVDDLMGATPTSVTAVTNAVLHGDRARAETAGLVTITYDNGVIAAIDCSWSQADTAPSWGGVRVVVAGTGGTAEGDFFAPRVRGLVSQTGLPVEFPYGPNFDDQLLKTFLAGVRTGTQPQPDVEAGLRTLRIVVAAQESARSGRTVALDDDGGTGHAPS